MGLSEVMVMSIFFTVTVRDMWLYLELVYYFKDMMSKMLILIKFIRSG